MFSRRTWARIVFFIDILTLPLRWYQWRYAISEDNESPLLVSQWLLAGVGLQVAVSWAYDNNLGSIRTKRRRRVLFGIFQNIFDFRVLPQSQSVQRNFSTGQSIGRIGYRFWFGILRPLPNADK